MARINTKKPVAYLQGDRNYPDAWYLWYSAYVIRPCRDFFHMLCSLCRVHPRLVEHRFPLHINTFENARMVPCWIYYSHPMQKAPLRLDNHVCGTRTTTHNAHGALASPRPFGLPVQTDNRTKNKERWVDSPCMYHPLPFYIPTAVQSTEFKEVIHQVESIQLG